MSDASKQWLFTVSFVGAVLFYSWAVVSLWLGPRWGVSIGQYGLVGVLPALLGVLCTVAALALHLDLRERDPDD